MNFFNGWVFILLLFPNLSNSAPCSNSESGLDAIIDASHDLSRHLERATCDVTQPFVIMSNANRAKAALRQYLDDDLVQDRCVALKKENTQRLADLVTGVAQCFEIDAFVFAGMVELESRFNRSARSPTGAVGLTQLTCVAMNENDRLVGIDPGALPETRDYFNEVIKGSEKSNQKSCIEKLVGNVYGNKKFQYRHLEERGIKSNAAKKKEIIDEQLFALVSGAVLLKQKLSEETRREVGKQKLSNRNTKFDQLTSTAKWKIYRKALHSYNGEGGKKHEVYSLKDNETLAQAERRIKGYFAKEDRARVSFKVSKDQKTITFTANSDIFYPSMVIRNALNMQNELKR